MHKNMFGKKNNRYLNTGVLVSLTFVLFIVSFSFGKAAVKDSDTDGLTDQAEISTYLTDPNNPDSDNDGVSDGDEILQGTNPINQQDAPTLTAINDINKNISLAWYIGRASGVLAFILLTLVVVNGLLMTTRLVFRLLPPALNYDIHYYFSWMALIAVVGHFAAFLFDPYFHLTIKEGLLPFSIDRAFSSRLGFDLRYAVGIGTLSFYGILALVLSSEMKGRFLSLKKWRVLHYMSFLTYLLFLAHGFLSGTDSLSWWMLWLYSLSAFLVISLTGLRIFASITKRKSVATTPPAPLDTPSSTE